MNGLYADFFLILFSLDIIFPIERKKMKFVILMKTEKNDDCFVSPKWKNPVEKIASIISKVNHQMSKKKKSVHF